MTLYTGNIQFSFDQSSASAGDNWVLDGAATISFKLNFVKTPSAVFFSGTALPVLFSFNANIVSDTEIPPETIPDKPVSIFESVNPYISNKIGSSIVGQPFHFTWNILTNSHAVVLYLEGSWNDTLTAMTGTVDLTVNWNLNQNSTLDQGQILNVPITLEKSEPICHFDLNGDHKSTGIEVPFSDCSHRLEVAKHKIDLLNQQLAYDKAAIADLQSDLTTAELADGLNSLWSGIKVALVFGGPIGDAILSGVSLGKLTNASIDIYEGNTSLSDAAKDVWTDVLAVITAGMSAEVKNVVTVIGVQDDIQNLATDSSQAEAVADMLSDKLQQWQNDLDNVKFKLGLWETERDAAAKCVNHSSAKPSAQTITENNPVSASDVARGGGLLLAADEASHSNKVMLNGTAAAKSVAHDTQALHLAGMPDGFNLAPGTRGNDIIHATASDLEGTDPVCLIAPGAGNDTILISSGAIAIQDGGGTDGVVVQDDAGQPASINDILFDRANPFDPGVVMLCVSDDLLVQTKGIERFVFGDGTLLAGGTFNVTNPVVAGLGPIIFISGAKATLKIGSAALSNHAFGNTITDFASGDSIDLTGLKFVKHASATYDSNTNLLTVKSGVVTDTLTLSNPDAGTFKVADDGHGGSKITLIPPSPLSAATDRQADSFRFNKLQRHGDNHQLHDERDIQHVAGGEISPLFDQHDDVLPFGMHDLHYLTTTEFLI